jgi:ectoine hydroxylase-related dioxygenase (phytanoyl-CoA dioxygenase family)
MILHSDIKSNETYLHDLANDGVSVFQNKISAELIEQLTEEVTRIKESVEVKIKDLSRPLKKHTDIAERHLGRLDYRCGFKADIFTTIAKPMVEIIKHASPDIDCNHYWGIIESAGGAGATNWHRDVYPMLNKTEGVNLGALDISLPPIYFTVLIPLVNVTAENGPTGFIKGSHKRKIVDPSVEEQYAPLTQPGDFIIFDGRTMHIGLANQTATARPIAYITFAAEWYHDQTFVADKYMFPELH